MKLVAKKIRVEGDCHIWTGCLNSDGYPKIGRTINGKTNFNIKGHRYVYEQINGEIPDGMVVRHTCDNPLCLNPAHLVVGTPTDNMRDRWERRRGSKQLSPLKVELLKQFVGTMSDAKLARKIGCSSETVRQYRIGNRKLY